MSLKTRIARLEGVSADEAVKSHGIVTVTTRTEAEQVRLAWETAGKPSPLIIITGVPHNREEYSVADVMAHIAEHGKPIHEQSAGPIPNARVFNDPL